MKEVLSYIENNSERYLKELGDLLAIPSVSTNPENAGDIRRCAEWVAEHLRAIGIPDVRIMATPGHPVVYGSWMDAPGKPTLLIYGHYDVQPPEPLELWSSPPFEATVRGDELYARGSSDDKGQFFIHLKSIEALLKTTGTLPVNVKFLIEGEEEIGSEHLDDFVRDQAELLKADLVLISDSSMFARGVPSICYGLRGLAYMQIDLVGPNKDLHSGSFGGSVLNPIQALSEIIAKLHDGKGRVTIPGFYDAVRPLSKKERDAYKKLPWNDKKYAKELGVKALYGEKGFTTLERLWARPTLECNGIWGGFTGEGAKTVLPSKASAKISMRSGPGPVLTCRQHSVHEVHQEDRPSRRDCYGAVAARRRAGDHAHRQSGCACRVRCAREGLWQEAVVSARRRFHTDRRSVQETPQDRHRAPRVRVA